MQNVRRHLARKLVNLLQTHCVLLKSERMLPMILLEVKVATVVVVGGITEAGGADLIKVIVKKGTISIV